MGNKPSPLLIGYLFVKLTNLETYYKTDFDHFCCSDDAVHGITVTDATSSSSSLLKTHLEAFLYYISPSFVACDHILPVVSSAS
jgi:hypothetical protein